jgi:hypothetical protein
MIGFLFGLMNGKGHFISDFLPESIEAWWHSLKDIIISNSLDCPSDQHDDLHEERLINY